MNSVTARASAALVLASMCPAAAHSAPGTLTASTGASYSKGDYGELTNTKVFAIPVALTYRVGGLKLRVSIPWVTIEGPASLIQTPDIGGGPGPTGNSGSDSGGGGPGPSSNSGSGGSGGGPGPSGGSGSSGGSGDVGVVDPLNPVRADRRSGIGDLNLTAVYSQHLVGGLYLEPGVKVKLPTASRAKNIGTGKTDVTVSSDLVEETGNLTFYAGARRKFAGKPQGSSIRSTWGSGAGASVRMRHGFLLGTDFDWQQSSVRSRGSTVELTGWASLRLSRRGRITFSATKGLNGNSADYAFATGIGWRL